MRLRRAGLSDGIENIVVGDKWFRLVLVGGSTACDALDLGKARKRLTPPERAALDVLSGSFVRIIYDRLEEKANVRLGLFDV
jgi:hypothetical protein